MYTVAVVCMYSVHSPSSLMRCCLLRRESGARSKEKSVQSSRGGKEMVWRRVKRTASITRSPLASVEPTLTVDVPLEVRKMWGGGENSMVCRYSMIPFQMLCWNSVGIFSLDKSCGWKYHRAHEYSSHCSDLRILTFTVLQFHVEQF